MPEFRRDTLALCASFFFCLLSVYIGTNWVPSMLTRRRLRRRRRRATASRRSTSAASSAPSAAPIVIVRLGSRLTMLTMAAGAVAGAVGLARDVDRRRNRASPCSRCWRGPAASINAVQTTMYALAAHVYPTAIRATGVGTAVAFGRIGGVVSPYARLLGARVGRRVAVFRADRRHDDAGVRGAGGGAEPHPARRPRAASSRQPPNPRAVDVDRI